MGITAPVFDDAGSVTAALSVVAMRRRVPPERLDALVTAVRTSADQLSKQLTIISS